MPEIQEDNIMKLEKLVGDRFKERPSDCQIDSHAIMVRGGYIKYMANGIFSSYTPTKRITKKIEQIIREEMDKIDGTGSTVPCRYARFTLAGVRQIRQHRQ